MFYQVVKKSILGFMVAVVSSSVFAYYPGYWDRGYVHGHPDAYHQRDEFYIEGGSRYWHGHHNYPHRMRHYSPVRCKIIRPCYGCLPVRRCFHEHVW